MALWTREEVYAVGPFTSKLAVSYLEHLALEHSQKDTITLKESFKRALEAVELPVTADLVSNLVKTIQKHRAEKGGEEGGRPLTWGEFCVCCLDIYSHHKPRNCSQPPVSEGLKSGAMARYRYSVVCKHDVFLGGSCNPTTWRQVSAIPTLQKHNVTYFNPQVDEWFPELIEIEEQAKEAATILLFVVDNQTRAISSMVEMGYLAGNGRDMVAVVEDIVSGMVEIRGELLSAKEVADLNRGRLFVRNLLAEGPNSFLADNLTLAMDAIVTMRKETQSVEHYCADRRVHCLAPSIGEELYLLGRVFSMYDNDKKNKLLLNEVKLALRSLHIEDPYLHQLVTKPLHGDPQLGSAVDRNVDFPNLWQRYTQHGLTFQEFCCVYTELKQKMLALEMAVHESSYSSSFVTSPIRWLASWFWTASSCSSSSSSSSTPFVDVFLNGSCGSTTWRNDVSIPLLKQYGVSYFNPQVANWDSRFLSIEREAKERCSVLLCVVTSQTLSVASVVEASFYIGRGHCVVLCVDDIQCPDNTTTVEGMELNAGAVKDYNRGRAYLVSIANKNRVPIYSEVAAATMAAIHCALCLRGQQKTYRQYPTPAQQGH